MRPRAPRWIVLAGALAACSTGCAPPGARTFAVVLEEPEYIDCFPVNEQLAVNPDQLAQYYSSITTGWRAAWDADLLRPEGGSLQLVAHGDRTLAWLDDLRQDKYQLWNGLVFEGEPQDGYVQLQNIDIWDTKTEECGVLMEAESQLYATIDGGEIEGRIRRVEHTYVSSFDSLCAAYVECARNIAVYGSEDP